MVGLKTDLIEHLSRNFADHEVLLESPPQKNYDEGIMARER